MKIIETQQEYELDVKRFYLPIKLEVNCPKCGQKIVRDFDHDYFHYPLINKKDDIHMYCYECDNEFDISGTLKISLEI